MTIHWHDDAREWCPCDEPDGATRCESCRGQGYERVGAVITFVVPCAVCNGVGALTPTTTEAPREP